MEFREKVLLDVFVRYLKSSGIFLAVDLTLECFVERSHYYKATIFSYRVLFGLPCCFPNNVAVDFKNNALRGVMRIVRLNGEHQFRHVCETN